MCSPNEDQSGQWWSITMATHYDITMGNDIARDALCEISMGNDGVRDTHCDVTMNNDVAMCCISWHHNALCCCYEPFLLCILCSDALMYYFNMGSKYGLKTRTSACLISLGRRTHSLFLCRAISLVLRTSEISLHKNNSCVLWNIPTQKQLMCSPQTDQTLTCSCYTIKSEYLII